MAAFALPSASVVPKAPATLLQRNWVPQHYVSMSSTGGFTAVAADVEEASGSRLAQVAAGTAFAAARLHGRRLRRPAQGQDSPQDGDIKAEAKTLQARLGAWWGKNAKLDSKTLRKMGLMCLLSYGFVSNVNAVILILLACYRAILATGASPLASKAALKQFGITWAGLYVISNLIRPLRISVALAISRYIDKFVNRIQDAFGCKRWMAITLAVLLLNVVGTIGLLYGGMILVSTVTGVPVSASQLGTLLKAGKAARAARA
mmetsp:Transcript_89432/g.158737  ORF Transcript_89432/g.158737 Transcript_89432/m.158737 type:complete len:261 (-) Transcript_89432:66-848(-)